MHRCLETLDVVMRIVDCLDNLSDAAALASLARINKAFSELALNKLWKSVTGEARPNITHLFRHLPEEAWIHDSRMICVTRPLTSCEWERVFFYSKRVQLLDFSFVSREVDRSYDSDEKSEDSFDSFDYLRYEDEDKLQLIQDIGSPNKSILLKKEGPLFPNLRLLYLSDPIGPEIADSLLSNSLSNISMYGFNCSDSKSLGTLLDLIERRCNSLESLDLTHSRYCTATTHVQLAFPVLNTLRRIAISVLSLDETLMNSLGRLPYLHHLQLGIVESVDTECIGPLSRKLFGFSALSSIKLDMSLNAIRLLLKCLPSNQLQKIDLAALYPIGQSITDGFKILSDEIAAECRVSSLVEVDLCLDLTSLEDSGGIVAVPFEAIQPFLKFKKLTRFVVHTTAIRPGGDVPYPYMLDVSDNDVDLLAKSWPDIEQLVIGGGQFNSNTRLTLAGLEPLASHCPNLHGLTVSIDARKLTQLSAKKLNEKDGGNKLRMLDLKNSPISVGRRFEADVAAQLTTLFPNLSIIDYARTNRQSSVDRRYWQAWNRIANSLMK